MRTVKDTRMATYHLCVYGRPLLSVSNLTVVLQTALGMEHQISVLCFDGYR
jgi:hypothetical protein